MECKHNIVVEVTRCGDSMRHYQCSVCGFEYEEPFEDTEDDAKE